MALTIKSVGNLTHQSHDPLRFLPEITMSHAYTEDQLVEQPAIGLFAELGWQVAGPLSATVVVPKPQYTGLVQSKSRKRDFYGLSR